MGDIQKVLAGLDITGCNCDTIRAEEVAMLTKKEDLTKLDRKDLVAACSWCMRIRGPHGEWIDPGVFFFKYFVAKFTHTICEECRDRYFPNFSKRGSKSHQQMDTA